MVDPETVQPATTLAVYVEGADGGPYMAHVPGLPGCYVRAGTREKVLAALPEAVRAYYAWLDRHGEPAPAADAAVEFVVAGESGGTGPFNPGDAAALFAPDLEPVTPEDMAYHFRLMDHGRADLLELVQHLRDEILDWQPGPMPVSVRSVLRHVGNAEEWYVSRLVAPETLPAEWDHDEAMAILPFLDMERRTAVERLRSLTQSERAGVSHPEHWTRNPEEAWTARKALRRFLEHEREHTGQIRGILSSYRRGLLARLAGERAGLLSQLLGLDAAALTELPVIGNWTLKDVLAHVVGWDRWQAETMQAMAAGLEPDFAAVTDIDAANEGFVAERADRSLEAVLAELVAVRARWLAWIEALPVEEFFRARIYAGYEWTFSNTPLRVQWQHDAEHAAQIGAWRATQEVRRRIGPKTVLQAALDAGRDELLAAVRLIPPEQRASYPVCGGWTTQDVVGHLADWQWLGTQGLRNMVAGSAPGIKAIRELDAWNAKRVEARRAESWAAVWADLQVAHRAFLRAVEALDLAQAGTVHAFPWGGQGTAYDWAWSFVDHDREHAEQLRLA